MLHKPILALFSALAMAMAIPTPDAASEVSHITMTIATLSSTDVPPCLTGYVEHAQVVHLI